MTDNKVIETLAEFFLDGFAEDAAGVGEWLAQSGQDVDNFYPAVEKLKARVKNISAALAE